VFAKRSGLREEMLNWTSQEMEAFWIEEISLSGQAKKGKVLIGSKNSTRK
jgi:hypothetical protein